LSAFNVFKRRIGGVSANAQFAALAHAFKRRLCQRWHLKTEQEKKNRGELS
jgi:hypothetical protein